MIAEKSSLNKAGRRQGTRRSVWRTEIDRATLVDEDRREVPESSALQAENKTGGYNEANKKRGTGLRDGLPGPGGRRDDCDLASER
jgi:hypothetical protein